MKKSMVILCTMLLLFAPVGSANAALKVIGTANYLGSDYNLIYEDNSIYGGLVWLDYSTPFCTWEQGSSWLYGLNSAGVLTYDYNLGVSVTWGGGERLPAVQPGLWGFPYIGELEHLYSVSLGNPAAAPSFHANGFENLLSSCYWTGNLIPPEAGGAVWMFDMATGARVRGNIRNPSARTLAVRSGEVVFAVPVSIDWLIVQHRAYETPPNPVYRVVFALKDSTGNYVTDGNIVTSYVLKDPGGSLLSYTNPFFEVFYEQDGSYNGTTWTTAAPRYTASDYGATLQGPLVAGNYTLEVSLRDGSKVTKQYAFNQEVDLPIISSSTFIVTSNSSGDFCVKWQGVSSTNYPNTSQRVLIDFYSSGTYVAELYVVVPTDVHEVCIPRSVLSAFTNSIGPFDQARFRLQFRTNDNNNRSYSNYYPVDVQTRPRGLPSRPRGLPFLQLLLGD